MTFLLSVKVWYCQGFDVIHATIPPDMFFLIGWFYRLVGKKFVFDQRDLAPEMFQMKFNGGLKVLHKLLLLLEWCSYQSAPIVITSNIPQKRRYWAWSLSRKQGLQSWKWTRFESYKASTPEHELKKGRRFLLAYVGEMEVQDGVDYALYALDEVAHKRGRRDVSLVLPGVGSEACALKELAHALQLDAYIAFTG